MCVSVCVCVCVCVCVSVCVCPAEVGNMNMFFAVIICIMD